MSTINLKPAEDALTRLLQQISDEHRNPYIPHDRWKRFTPDELLAMTDADDLIRDPVRQACGRALTVIGQQLHTYGADMDAVAERVWTRAPQGERGRWESALAAYWSGIGNWAS